MRGARRTILLFVVAMAAVLLTSGVALSSALKGDDKDNRIDGTADADTIRGYKGKDTIEGGSGNDDLLATDDAKKTKANPYDDADDVIRGEEGDDDIMGSAGANELDGGDGMDSIVAGPLNDKAVDRIFGGDGNDEIGAFNPVPSRDVIDCGGGTDRVMADSLDEIHSNCEEVEIVQPPDKDMAVERQ